MKDGKDVVVDVVSPWRLKVCGRMLSPGERR